MSKSQVTTKNFKTQLAAFTRSSKTQRDNLQTFVRFALDHAKEQKGGDFTYLNQTIQAAVGVKSLRTQTLLAFIKAHCSNIIYTKLKDGSQGFRKATKGEPCEFKTVNTMWYDFDAKGEAKDELEAEKMINQLRSMVTRYTKALEDGKVKAEDVESVKALIQSVKGITPEKTKKDDKSVTAKA